MESRNVLMAVILSTVVLIVWATFFEQPVVEQTVSDQKIEKNLESSSPTIDENEKEIKNELSRDDIINKTNRIKISNDNISGSISLDGGVIDDIIFKNYNENLDSKNKVVFLNPKNSPREYFIETGWASGGSEKTKLPLIDTIWKSKENKWEWEKVIDIENEPHPDWPIPIPGVMSAILISMDDKYLYLNNWLHGDMRQYDISDPHNPKLTGQVWMGGLLGKAPVINGVKIAGGPQMYQLSLDGKRMYVTTSLFSTWDNQFYPDIRTQGGAMIMIDCDVKNGGMKINKDFIVDFGKEPNGPSRCHESRYPGGDCTSDIWL